MIILHMAYLLVAKQKAIWHAFYVVQKWILDVPHTLKKNVYLGHYHYHAKGHPYRRDHDAFNRQVELKSTPPRVSAIIFLQMLEEREAWLARRFHTLKDRENPIHTRGVKRKSLFFCLPYWQVKFC
jgi:hypothetical protein